MALKEFYIGTVGPMYLEDTDPLANAPGQLVRQEQIAGLMSNIEEFVTGTATPTGKKFKLIKYEDGTMDWVEVT